MKRSLLVASLFALSLAACGDKPAATPAAPQAAAPVAPRNKNSEYLPPTEPFRLRRHADPFRLAAERAGQRAARELRRIVLL